jgi:hypothetical protein
VKKRYKALILLAIVFVVIPTMLWLAWNLTEPKQVDVFIMDKTSYSKKTINQRAINWVLTHRKYVNSDGKLYDPAKDYFGFYPIDINVFETKDLKDLSSYEVEELSHNYDIAYYSDSYGIFSDIWPIEDPENFPAEMIYGGLDSNDFLFLEKMMKNNGLVIAELLFTSLTTRTNYRDLAEDLFELEWQGWTGKFFHQFDIRKENAVPPWVITLYERQYNEKWDFRNMGVVLVHEDETIVILEYPTHIKTPQPRIKSSSEKRRDFGMSDNIPFPGWLEITFPMNPEKQTISWFDLDPTPAGLELLNKHQIPSRFPAVIEVSGRKNILYLTGDFSYSNVPRRFVRMKGSRFVELFLADLNDVTDRKAFFFGYYLPVFSSILKNHYNSQENNN